MPGTERAAPLSKAEDPAQLSVTAGHRWAVTRLQLGCQTGDGRVTACSHRRFRKGDFVDVTAGIDIVRWKESGQDRCQVYLNMRRVVQLKARTADAVHNLHASGSASKIVADVDFSFDADDAMDQN